jgi:hypothetical protein
MIFDAVVECLQTDWIDIAVVGATLRDVGAPLRQVLIAIKRIFDRKQPNDRAVNAPAPQMMTGSAPSPSWMLEASSPDPGTLRLWDVDTIGSCTVSKGMATPVWKLAVLRFSGDQITADPLALAGPSQHKPEAYSRCLIPVPFAAVGGLLSILPASARPQSTPTSHKASETSSAR